MYNNSEIKANLPRPEGFLQKLQCIIIRITNNNLHSTPSQKVSIYGNELPDNFERKVLFEDSMESCNMAAVVKAIRDGIFSFNNLRLFGSDIARKGAVELEYIEYGIKPGKDEKPSSSNVEYTDEGKITKINVFTNPYQMQTDLIELIFNEDFTLNPNSDLFIIVPSGKTWEICFVYDDDLTKKERQEGNN